MTRLRLRRAALPLVVAASVAAAALPLFASSALAAPTPSPAPVPPGASASSGSATPAGAVEGTGSRGSECQGAVDPQVRVFGITAASTAPGTKRVEADQRTRFAYTNMPVGSAVRDYVGFVNKSCFPVTLSLYAADAYNSKDGSLNILESAKKSKDLGTWIQIGGSPTITVAPRSTAIRQFVLHVPAGSKPGDHVGAIIASSVAPPPKTAAGVPVSRVATEYRVGARVQVRVAGALKPGLAVSGLRSDYSQGRNPFWGGSATVTYTVRNTGNVTVSAPQQVQVDGWFNGTTAIPSVPKVEDLLPGSEVTYTAVAPNLFPLDVDTASVRLSPTDLTDQPLTGLTAQRVQDGFLAVSWALVLLVVAGFAGLGYYLWRRFRRGSTRPPAGPAEPSFDDEAEEMEIVNYADAVNAAGRADRSLRLPQRATRPVRPFGPVARTVFGVGAAVALGVGLLLAPALAGESVARAEDAGKLTFLPATGQDLTPIWAVTSGPCPAPTKVMVGFLDGGNFPADTIAVAATTAEINKEIPFGVHLGDTFSSLAVENNAKLVAGVYTLRLLCLSYGEATTYKEFVGSVTFTDPTHYTATAPPDVPAVGVPLGILSHVYPKNAAVQAAAIAEGLTPPPGAVTPTPGPASSVPGVAGSPGAAVGAVGGAADTNRTVASGAEPAREGGFGTWLVLGVGGVVIAALVGLRVFASYRDRRAVGGGDGVSAHEDEQVLENAWPDGGGE
jgi:hypothetical protein